MESIKKYTAGLLALSLMTMSVMIVTPTLAPVMAEYTNIPVTLVMYLTALPTIFAIPSALVTGALVKKFGGKTMALVTLAIMCISGISIMFIKNFYGILAMRALNGVGIGFGACGMIMTPQLIAPEGRRSVSGLSTFVSNAAGILYGLVSGFLASHVGWRYSYLCYLITVPAFFIVLACIPNKTEMEKKLAAMAAAAAAQGAPGGPGAPGAPAKREKFNWGYYWILFLLLLSFISVGAIGSNLSMHIVGKGLGTTTSVGIAMGVNTLTAAIVGLFFYKLTSKIKRYVYTIGPIIEGIGLILIAKSTSFGMLLFAEAVTGFGWAFVLGECGLLVYGNTVPSNRGIALSIMSSVMNLAQFLSPMVMVSLGGALIGPNPWDRFLFAGLIFILVGILYLFVDPKKANAPNTQEL